MKTKRDASKRELKDLRAKKESQKVKGGAACATGKHFPEGQITTR
jgi:hypothetical protein